MSYETVTFYPQSHTIQDILDGFQEATFTSLHMQLAVLATLDSVFDRILGSKNRQHKP